MKKTDNKQKSQILVLTEFSNRDRNAADMAVRLAKKIGSDVLLLTCFPLTGTESSDLEFEKALQLTCEKEIARLNEGLKGEKEYSIDIQGLAKGGDLYEQVIRLKQTQNILMVVMGGRPIKNDNGYFCSDVNEIIYKTDVPVLIVPEGKTVDLI